MLTVAVDQAERLIQGLSHGTLPGLLTDSVNVQGGGRRQYRRGLAPHRCSK
jgi:hypothetical protein